MRSHDRPPSLEIYATVLRNRVEWNQSDVLSKAQAQGAANYIRVWFDPGFAVGLSDIGGIPVANPVLAGTQTDLGNTLN